VWNLLVGGRSQMATLWQKLKSVSIEEQTTIHIRLPVCQLQTEEPLESARGKICPAFKTKESPFFMNGEALRLLGDRKSCLPTGYRWSYTGDFNWQHFEIQLSGIF